MFAHGLPIVRDLADRRDISPVSRSVWRSASTTEPSVGWLVLPDSASMAQSTASTPPRRRPGSGPQCRRVSWVWKWTGRPISSFSALTSIPRTRAKPRHVLQPQDMRAGVALRAPCSGSISGRIWRGRGQQVAGIADRPLADLAAVDHRIHGDAHVLDPVQTVEDAEHVDAGRGGLFDKGLHRRCRDSWCSRRRCWRAAASASSGWACGRGCRAAAATGIPAGKR